jgi:hypothetical protein
LIIAKRLFDSINLTENRQFNGGVGMSLDEDWEEDADDTDEEGDEEW